MSDDEHSDSDHQAGRMDAGQRVASTASTTDMASAFQSLLKQKPGHRDPVLARRTRLLSAPDEAALDAKAQAILRRSKKQALLCIRVLPDPAADLARERLLKKIATRGAVQLFNAVHKHQQVRDAAIPQKKRPGKYAGKSHTQPEPPTATTTTTAKVDFMDLLKKGPARII